jgi:hypothetical protein
MNKILACLICAFCFIAPAVGVKAQVPPVITVQGKLLDKYKSPIQGVTVAEVDADQRTVRAVTTDVEGNFAIKIANKKNKLSFSFIGYKTLTQNINERTTFNITLETSSSDLGEVVVVAQRKTDNGMVAIAEKNVTIAGYVY